MRAAVFGWLSEPGWAPGSGWASLVAASGWVACLESSGEVAEVAVASGRRLGAPGNASVGWVLLVMLRVSAVGGAGAAARPRAATVLAVWSPAVGVGL